MIQTKTSSPKKRTIIELTSRTPVLGRRLVELFVLSFSYPAETPRTQESSKKSSRTPPQTLVIFTLNLSVWMRPVFLFDFHLIDRRCRFPFIFTLYRVMNPSSNTDYQKSTFSLKRRRTLNLLR